MAYESCKKSKWLTRVVNLLPGYNTKEESEFTLKGELAYLAPDPNTKRSAIPSDNNESVAYVDDMEGSKKIVSLGKITVHGHLLPFLRIWI